MKRYIRNSSSDDDFIVNVDLDKVDWKKDEQRRIQRELDDEADAYDLEHSEGIYADQYIPDMTERFPEGLNGPDMYAERTPEDIFWDDVDRAEQYEEEGKYSKFPNKVVFYWVSYWLQDGRQTGAMIAVPQGVGEGGFIEDALMKLHGNEYGDIADYGDDGGVGQLLAEGYNHEGLYRTDEDQYIVVDADGFFDHEIEADDPNRAVRIFEENR